MTVYNQWDFQAFIREWSIWLIQAASAFYTVKSLLQEVCQGPGYLQGEGEWEVST